MSSYMSDGDYLHSVYIITNSCELYYRPTLRPTALIIYVLQAYTVQRITERTDFTGVACGS